MATEIINNGVSLKIIRDGITRNIIKQQIHEISMVGNNIKMDLGKGALGNVFIAFNEVTNPQTASPAELLEVINTMLQTNPGSFATEQNQQQEISQLQNIHLLLLFQTPSIEDQTTPKTIYKGFAAPGSNTSDAVWAIQKTEENIGIVSHQWAEGNRNFDKIWDNRKTLNYN